MDRRDVGFQTAQTLINVGETVKIFGTKRSTADPVGCTPGVGTCTEFWQPDMNRCSLLSLLLMAERELGEKGFVGGWERIYRGGLFQHNYQFEDGQWL